MTKNVRIAVIALLVLSALGTQAQDLGKAPRVYTDKFKTLLKEGDVVDSGKHDLGVVVRLTKAMKVYDLVEVLCYRKYNNTAQYVGDKPFYPASKEFQIKYDKLDSIKIPFVDPTKASNGYDGDGINTGYYSAGKIFVFQGDRGENNNYYFVVKGFIKTGSHVKYSDDGSAAKMVDDYDTGTQLTEESVHIKAFEKAAPAPKPASPEPKKKNVAQKLFGR